jgi:hypothetical protein
MPAKSAKQKRFMAAVANNPKFAKKVGVPQSVGDEFMKKGYRMGGMPMADEMPMKEKMPMKRKKKRPMDDMMAVTGTGAAAPRRGMKKGGKVRGCGMARGGAVRKCKMVKMKGSDA